MASMTIPRKPRKRRTKAQIGELHRVILEFCAAHHPVGARQVYYHARNVLPDLVGDLEKDYKNLDKQLVNLRETGRLPYGWIADGTRTGYWADTHASPEAFVRAAASAYRYDLWGAAGVNDRTVEVWCESRGLAGSLRGLCREFGVSLFPCGGWTGKTGPYEAAEDYAGYRTATVLYCGDHDPAGVGIENDLAAELRGHASRLSPPVSVAVRRVLVTPEQIHDMNLPQRFRKKGEKRRPDILRCTDAEAIPVDAARRIVREAIASYLPDGALEYARLMEVEGVKYLETFGLGDMSLKAARADETEEPIF